MRLTEENFQSRLKYFVPIWLFPFITILAAVNEQLNGAQQTWFNETFAVWAFFVLNMPIMYGWLTGKIPIKELIIFWWLTPFVLWVGLVMLKLAIVG